MDQELLPLSEGKTRLHEVVRDLARRDVILIRHGRPVAALVGFERYRGLVEREGAPPSGEGPLGLGTAGLQRLARVCEGRGVRRLVLFGSRARGEADPSSDVDLLATFDPSSPRERAEALFGLQHDLELLLGTTVDLLEDDAVSNPYLREAIERAHVVLYEAA
jgi:hypothetical protein